VNELVTIKLRGELGKRFGKVHRLAVDSVSEALRALMIVVPGFAEYLRDNKRMEYKVLLKNEPIIDEFQFQMACGFNEICLVPRVRGAGGDGLGNFFMGAALIALAIAAPEALTFIGSTGFTIMMGMGTSMMLGGVMQLISGTAPSNPSNNTNSYAFNSAQNSSGQGVPIPVAYGKFKIVPPIISQEIDTEMFTTDLFNYGVADGLGNWLGDGDTSCWCASLDPIA